MEILRIENLNFKYPSSKENALTDINFSINSGEFIVVCGESGCGKTTLLKLMKRELAPAGEKSGKIYYNGAIQDELDERTSACEIGYVLQNPENQIVTDKVWHELAFGLENMGVETNVIRRRVGEMASYFGIEKWFRQKTDELSGGQKQLLNLAAVMVMQPKILILDEPTGQLDPIAAGDFIATLQKLNREFGLTIILVEHRLEEVFPIADRVLLMDSGKILLFDKPKNIGKRLYDMENRHPMLLALPSATRIFNGLDIESECPLTVKEGRDFLENNFECTGETDIEENYLHSENIAVELKNVWFRYELDLPDVLRGANLKVYEGEFFSILGGNATGKTTTLNVISNLNKAYRGTVSIFGKKVKNYKGNSLYRKTLAYLPQDPQTVFIKDNLRDDYSQILESLDVPKDEIDKKIDAVVSSVGISHLLEKHPYDLSGGEQQKCALAKMLLLEPKILLLDEPTKGLDAHSKKSLAQILLKLKSDGMTILAVTHDVEFAAEISDRCALFFDGEALCCDVPKKFFSENNFYTTAANRMARRIFKNAVTCEQVIFECKKGKRK